MGMNWLISHFLSNFSTRIFALREGMSKIWVSRRVRKSNI
jgi:hypothetical protein